MKDCDRLKVVISPRFLRDLREELEDLTDYLDLLEARARNFGKKRYSTEQVKKMLNLK